MLEDDDVVTPLVTPVAVKPTIETPQKQHNDMQVINHNEQLVIDSRDVAEMVGKQHKHLMRDIKGYAEVLTESKFGLSDFFIENTYQDTTGRTLPCYLLTKKGCDMVANKMTGAKGVLFTATYVTRFEEMEEQLKSQAQVASYMIDDPIKRAEQWIIEQKEIALLAEKVQEQTIVIERNKRTCIYENLSYSLVLFLLNYRTRVS
ncbi:Rha family transcriptional regulator [Lysinibacillus sp. NPDC094177]|uniref:Rha family transcriptional regulator n=1 Tax=Lysinibacillus sp. NPDC094177 TaxID=3390580 RepID=UPI003D057CE0